MASLWKHPKSQFWTACYTDKDGKQVKRSTKQTKRAKALAIALEFERVELQSRRGTVSTVDNHAGRGWFVAPQMPRQSQ